MGKGNSKWVEIPTIADLSGINDLIEKIPFSKLTENIEALVDVLQIIQSLLDIVDVIISGVDDLNKLAFETVVKSLEILKDEIVELLRNALNFGLYVLPQFEAFDFQKVIRNEILGGNIDPKALDPTGFKDTLARVPNKDNPSKTHFEVQRRQGGLRTSNYDQFIRDVVNSFNDPNDILRPVFDTSQKLSSVAIVAASEDLATFILAYLLISFFITDDKTLIETSDRIVKTLRVAIGEQEFLGRQFDDAKKARVLQLVDAIVAGKEKAKGNAKEFVKELLGLLSIDANETLDGDASFVSVRVTGESRNYQVFGEGDIEQTEFVQSITLNPDETVNNENLAKIQIQTSGAGKLSASWEFGNGKILKESYGVVSGSVDIYAPLVSVGEASMEPGNNDVTSGAVNSIVNRIKPLTSSPATSLLWTPTAALNQQLTFSDGVDVAELKQPTTVTFTLEDAKGVEKSIKLAIPRWERLTGESLISIQDGYSHNITFKVEPSGLANKRKVLQYVGTVEKIFPISTRRQETDFTRYGPDFREVDITVSATPQIQINDSFTGELIVNGKRYTPDDITIGSRTAEMLFKGVDLSNSEDGVTLVSFVSELRTPVFISTNSNENGVYTLRSSPQTFVWKTVGGKLGAVKITSGDTLNVTGNFGDKNDSSPFVNRWNATFSRDSGSKTTEAIKIDAKYRLTGRRANGAFVYAIVHGPGADGKSKKSLEIITDPTRAETVIDPSEDRGFIAKLQNESELISGNFFSQTINLPIEIDKKEVYAITVYQTNDKDLFEAIRTIRVQTQGDLKSNPELAKALDNMHKSDPAVIKVRVDSRNIFLQAPLPNWITFSTESFFPVVEPIDAALTDIVEAIRSSIPAGPYDQIKDWLDLLSDKIQDLIDLAKQLKDIVDNLQRFLNIGGDGLWALGISGANGVEGMKERLQKQEVPKELKDARFVTGVVLLVPDDFLGVPAGSLLMETVFAKLPSVGFDNAKPEQNRLSFEDKFKELGLEASNRALKDINSIKGSLAKLNADDLKALGKSMEDIE